MGLWFWGFRVRDLGFRVWGLGFRVWGVRVRAAGYEFEGEGLGHKIPSLGGVRVLGVYFGPFGSKV